MLITGASGGLGAAVARWLASVGVSLTLVARKKIELDAVAHEVELAGARALPVRSDISSFFACRNAVCSGIETFGRLDALINNAAAVEPLSRIRNTDPSAWRNAMGTNLLGPLYLIRDALPALQRTGGRVINITSGAADISLVAAGAYCTSKAALNHLTRVMGHEIPDVTSVAIRPGIVDTPMQAHLRFQAPQVMPPEQSGYYRRIKSEGLLEPSRVPARGIAWAALHAPAHWSGQIMDYNDPRITEPSLAYFGDYLR